MNQFDVEGINVFLKKIMDFLHSHINNFHQIFKLESHTSENLVYLHPKINLTI
jgi:hypothetical protein